MSIFKNLEEDFENFWNNTGKPFLHDDIEPTLKAFVEQFNSQFGRQALAAALGAVEALAEPGAAFGSIAAGLATTLFNDAKATATSTAELDIKQILQTVQSALQVTKAANGIVTQTDAATAASIEGTTNPGPDAAVKASV